MTFFVVVFIHVITQILMCLLFQVVPLGLNTYDLMMNFGIKETDCLKSSGEDPQRCAFRVGFFVVRPDPRLLAKEKI